jgi:hypothetical protein
MKISLVGIYDRGSLEKERLHFRAEVDLDLSFFVVLDSHYLQPTTVEAANRMGYWFVPRSVKKGENVVLYSRAGSTNTETRPDGAIYHFMFRGHSNPLYASPNACAVLMEVQTWITTPQAPKPSLPSPVIAPLPKVPPPISLADLLGTNKKR